MKRLTYKDASDKWVLSSLSFNLPKCGLPTHLSGVAVNRLAEFEEIGVEPSEIVKDHEKQISYELTGRDKETLTGICKCGRVTEIIDSEHFCKYCGQKVF